MPLTLSLMGFSSTLSEEAAAAITAHCPISGGATSQFSNDTRPRNRWRDLLEQFLPLGAQHIFELREAGDVATRP